MYRISNFSTRKYYWDKERRLFCAPSVLLSHFFHRPYAATSVTVCDRLLALRIALVRSDPVRR
jgi:hypothetical protein